MAKQKWQNLEKKISKLVHNKQSISLFEKDMERCLVEREKLSRYLEKALKKRDRAINEMKDCVIIEEIEEEIENLKANIDYVHENIAECQSSIVQIEETKDDLDASNVNHLLPNTDLEEAKYLLEKVLNMAINQSIEAAQRETAVKEMEAQLKQVIENNAVQQQLLSHVLQQTSAELLSYFTSQDPEASGVESPRSSSPIDNAQDFGILAPASGAPSGKKKARNVTATPEQMLFVDSSPPKGDVPVSEHGDLATPMEGDSHGVLGDAQGTSEVHTLRRTVSSSTFTHSPALIKSRESKRVASPESPTIFEAGEIYPISGKQEVDRNPLLICTHIVNGHTKPVLCIECTEDVLFSSSKDCTVKIWDLHTLQEIHKLTDYTEEVVKVRYCEYTRLAFTVSGPYIRIWDVREKPSCRRTLSSSGTSRDGRVALSSFPREHSSYTSRVNDIALNHYGTTLYSATANTMRMWDLKMFQSIGTLNGNHQLAVTCLSVDDMGMDMNLVISGSKDRSIKLFEVMEGTRGVHYPKWGLLPPHSDEVRCLAINGDFLFSGSKDMSIRMWDLQKRSCTKFLHKAHENWVTSLNIVPAESLVLSACKSGFLKLWSANTCDLLGSVKAHGAAINCLASNSAAIFTASADTNVGMWKYGSASCSSDFDSVW